MAVNNDGTIHTAFGLYYHGMKGALLAVVELVVVTTALLAAHFSSGARRTTGLIVLMAWAGLWFGNALRMRTLGWNRPLDTAILGLAVVVTVGWAVLSSRGTALEIE